MVRIIAIPGTGSGTRVADWDAVDSPFMTYLRTFGIVQVAERESQRYGWDGALDGIDKHDVTWERFGRALFHYVVPPLGDGTPAIPPEETFIIAHSHAGQVVSFACGKYGLKVAGLVTVGMPIRGDKRMQQIYADAKVNITRHVHLRAGWRDYWQLLGSLKIGDGQWGIHRDHPHAKNYQMPKGHGNVLREPALFNLWEKNGWLEAWLGRQVSRVAVV
jgi:hypothetical protein